MVLAILKLGKLAYDLGLPEVAKELGIAGVCGSRDLHPEGVTARLLCMVACFDLDLTPVSISS